MSIQSPNIDHSEMHFHRKFFNGNLFKLYEITSTCNMIISPPHISHLPH